MADQTTNHSLNKPIPWDESDEDNNVWGDLLNANFDELDSLVPHELTSSTFTASGGQTENEFTLSGAVQSQTRPFEIVVSVAADPTFDADYQYHTNIMRSWDSTNERWDVIVEVVWDLDPGTGNDVNFEVSIRDKTL